MKKLVKSFTKKDFTVQFFKGTGPGGQHKNKKETACRIVHNETELTAECQEHKSQAQNKKEAFKKLAQKIKEHYNTSESKQRYLAGTERNRTYNESKDLVVDHLTGKKYSYRHTIGKGDLELLIEERIRNLK